MFISILIAPGVEVPVLPVADVSERPGDEGGNDLDEREPDKGEPQKVDYRVDPDDVPGLEDESGEENEAPPGLEAEESSSNKDEGTLELIQF